MQKGESYIMMYAAGVCLLCSVLLAGTTMALKPRQDAESELDRKRNVLKAFDAPMRDEATGEPIAGPEVERLYTQHVREITVTASGRTLPLFQWEVDGRTERIALPVSGKGLWSTIYGYLALDARATTILGITFYKHGETPGLGGEIEQPWFQENFKGRQIFDKGTLRRIEVAKGKARPPSAEGPVQVDGISGATLTGAGVTAFLNEILAGYEPYFMTLREVR